MLYWSVIKWVNLSKRGQTLKGACMLTEREILDIQQFYSEEEELALLEMAMYFQKMLIQQYQCEDTGLELNSSSDGTCYVVSVGKNKVLVYLIVYEDCMNAQICCDSNAIGPDTTELLARKISMLANRTTYLKELQASVDDIQFNCNIWFNIGREYATNRLLESNMKEFMWLADETDRYLSEHAERRGDGGTEWQS